MGPYYLLIPEFIVLAGALVVLFAEWLPGGGQRAGQWGAVFAAVAAAAVPLVGAGEESLFYGMLALDERTGLIRVAIAGLAAIYLLWMGSRGIGSGRQQEATSLVLFSVLGGMFLVAASDIITLYMSLELSTMPAYVLMGYGRRDARSLEGALKYFLLSLLTSLVMVYGLSFVYGYSGATTYAALDLAGAGRLGVLVAVMVAAGFMAKLSAAPFHYWTPDAYEGATPHAVAFVSTVPKVAGLVAMVHLMEVLVPTVEGLPAAFAVAAAASMVLGNLAAFPQQDMRRLMAYWGIAHTGYLLMAFTASGDTAAWVASFYAVAYAVPSMGVMLVVAEHGSDIGQLAGLGSRRPWAAWSMVVFFVSLVGIPPTVGFFGKLYLFGTALDAGIVWLVVLAVLASVVSLGYYFKVVRSMFLSEPDPDSPVVEASVPATLALAVILLATLALGASASPLMSSLGLAFP